MLSINIVTIIQLGSTYRFFTGLVLAVIFICHHGFGQSITTIEGQVLDAADDSPLQFVNVYFKGTEAGTITDENGHFSITNNDAPDSLVISYVGYLPQTVAVIKGGKQNIIVRLENELVNLSEVVVLSGENPAWEIIRHAVKSKKLHDKRSLKAYEYQSYNRIEFDIDNISTKMSKRKIVSKIWEGMDSTSLEKNALGNAILPIFLSETVSKYYVKNDPFSRREEVQKTKVSGVAVEDGSMISQLVGTAYQDYNFYQNWLRFLEKEFISPIADSWKIFYDYEILDTTMVDGSECYQLSVFPNRKQDPAFNGVIWITTDSYALKKLDLYIDKSTNLNFIERIDLKQELDATPDGPWLPTSTSLTIDVSNLGKNAASMLIKAHNVTSDWEINDLKDRKFYANEVIIAEDFNTYPPDYWENNRPNSLTQQQLQTYQNINTLVEIPQVKSYVNFIKLATTGYWRRGKVDFGPYLYAYAHNNYEGHAFRLGLKTNEYFDRKITLRGYLGYGTADEKWKYGLTANYIIKRKPWTEISMHSSLDVEQVGLRSDDLRENNYLFYAATRWQTFLRPYYISKNSVSIKSEPAKGLIHQLTLKHEYYDPQYSFYYYKSPGTSDVELKSDVSAPTITFSTRWARDEMFLQNGNERVSLGTKRSPIIQFDYTYGFKNFLDGDFEFHKLQLELKNKLRMGGLGEARYKLTGGYIIGQVPYLLLENHIGNESSFYTNGAFNTMNYFEFVSDEYASMRYEHHFQGLVMNKIPLIRALKWRLIGSANVLYGSLRQENIDIISPIDPDGQSTAPFGHLDKGMPYIELGYGIENIFKVLRIDAFHRLTYRDKPDANKFALKMSFQFNL